MTDTNIISTTQFTQYAPEIDVSSYTDATLSGIISMASKQVSDYLMFTPIAEDIVDEVKDASIDTNGDLVIFPAKIPVISVSSLKLTKGTTNLTLNLTDNNGNARYNLNYTKRYIRFPNSEMIVNGTSTIPNFFYLRGTQFYVTMSYRGGFEVASLPAAITQATILYIREYLSGKDNTSGAKKVSQGGISLEYFDGKNNKSDLVSDAERLLAPYRRIG